MTSSRWLLPALLVTVLTGCGREAEPERPFVPWTPDEAPALGHDDSAAAKGWAEHKRWLEELAQRDEEEERAWWARVGLPVPKGRPEPRPEWMDEAGIPVEPAVPRSEYFPHPEAGLAPASGLTSEESPLVGEYRLREFIAMSGQVPGPDARLNGTMNLSADGRRVTLHVLRHTLNKPASGGRAYRGGGRWRLVGDEIVLEPFVLAEDEPLVGPGVARWKVVREDGKVLLKAGEFTYERVVEK